MNKIQIKSLIFSILIALDFLAITFWSNIFTVGFIVLLLLTFTALYFVLELTIANKEELREDLKFLIVPILFNVGALFFVSSLFQPVLKIIFVFIVLISNFYLFVAMKRVQNLEERAAIFQRNVVISVSFLALLFSYSLVYRTYVLFSIDRAELFPSWLVVGIIALIYYFISYFLAWENGMNMKKFLPYNLVGSLLMAEISFVGLIWIVNYPVFTNIERAALGGVPLPAVLLTIIFYFIWGIITHKMDRSLTRKVMTEYIGVTIIFLFVLLVTARWLPRL